MTRLSVEELVRALVARSVPGGASGQIADTMTLRELGYSDADAAELQLRLGKAVSPRPPTGLTLEQAVPVTPDSDVKAVIAGLQKLVPAHAATAGGAESLGDPQRREVEIAVIAALSELSPNLDFSQVESEMELGKDLGLDAAAIAEVKIGVFKAFVGEAFPPALSTVQIGTSSTVDAMVEQVHAALPAGGSRGESVWAGSLPGDVITGRKGNKETGIVVSGRGAIGVHISGDVRAPGTHGVEIRERADHPPGHPGDDIGAPPGISLAGDNMTERKG